MSYVDSFVARIMQERNLNFLLSLVPLTQANIVCAGDENTIGECSFESYDGNPPCSHRNDLIVECFGKYLSVHI